MAPMIKELWMMVSTGGGRAILETLRDKEQRNISVFVVRFHPADAPKLHKRRFAIIKDLAKSALMALRKKQRKRNDRYISQESLASVLSSVDSLDFQSVPEPNSVPVSAGEEEEDGSAPDHPSLPLSRPEQSNESSEA